MAITAGDLIDCLVNDDMGGGSDTPILVEDSDGIAFEIKTLVYDLTRNAYVLKIV